MNKEMSIWEKNKDINLKQLIQNMYEDAKKLAPGFLKTITWKDGNYYIRIWDATKKILNKVMLSKAENMYENQKHYKSVYVTSAWDREDGFEIKGFVEGSDENDKFSQQNKKWAADGKYFGQPYQSTIIGAWKYDEEQNIIEQLKNI